MNTQETRDTKEITDTPETTDTTDSGTGDLVDLEDTKANSETWECEQILGRIADTLKDLADNGDILGAWDLDSLADTEWDTLEVEYILCPAEILDTSETRDMTGDHEITVWQDANTMTDLAVKTDHIIPLDEILVWQDVNTMTNLDSEREHLSDTEMKDNTADLTDK